MGTELAVINHGAVEMRRPGIVTAEDLMPVLDLVTAVKRHNFMVEVTKNLMLADVDFGVIPGTGTKPTLLKPGAERLCTLFGMSPEFIELSCTEDWDGSQHGGESFFYYRYKCRLTKNGITMGEGIGSCNSWESKYRYRAGERKCPGCGKASIIKGKEEYGGGWLCFAKKGGCGAKYKEGDKTIEGQSIERVPNPDIADQVNTIQKMAQKRALVAGVLVATNASEFYTQDVEDMVVKDMDSGTIVDIKADRPTAQRNTPAQQQDLAQRRIAEEKSKLEAKQSTAAPAATAPPKPAPSTPRAAGRPSVDEQIPPALQRLWKGAETPAGAEKAISWLFERMVALLGEDAAGENWTRIVGPYGEWTEFARKEERLPDARKFIRDLFLFVDRIPAPPAAEQTVDVAPEVANA